ncbi:TldD/PmbA family protein [Saccharothrix sp. ST-888]|uniref:TldD/PmbA family protein n=1 Tax=Saccharothrix sp. ST-888 TaxID=1427391 RepID=UPI0018CE67A0|nr:TldD/PmbA family protein [Saccharothrix sp. ST-888]
MTGQQPAGREQGRLLAQPDQDRMTQESEVLLAQLRRRRRSDWLEGTVLVDSSVRRNGRYADGRLAETTLVVDAGMAVRLLTPDGFRYRAASAPADSLVDELLGGKSPASGRRWDGAAGQRASWDAAGAAREADTAELMALLDGIDAAARAQDPRIVQVLIFFDVVRRGVRIGSLDQGVVEDRRDLVYLTVRTVAKTGDRIAAGFYTPGIAGAPGLLDAAAIGRESAVRAVHSLEGRPAPVGEFPVVVAGGRGIVLLHEACCHPLEGDEVLKGSIYSGRVGERIAAPGVTIVDDAALPDAVGSHRYDDERVPASATTLVEDGVLRSFLTDRESALRLGTSLTSNGRCHSYQQPPIPRMTNTCLGAGALTPEEIIADTPRGIYAEHVAGGEVVEATGEFVFRVTNGYYIENGRLTDPIAETTIAGNGAKVLTDIDAIGNDVQLGAAKCGKFGQLIPVGVSGPTLRVASMLVGGTS